MLATGIVVDDAIVVVENIERKIEEGLNPLPAAHAAMGEVTRPIISIMLVLCAVFIPVAFVTGLTGQFYRQFGDHHRGQHAHFHLQFPDPVAGAGRAAAEAAQCAARLCFSAASTGCWARFFRLFNRGLRARPPERYGHGVRRITAIRWVVLGDLRRACWCCTWGIFRMVPGGFIPAQDKQYLIGIVQLPDAASLDRTEKVVRQMSAIANADARASTTRSASRGLSVQGFVNLSNAAVSSSP